MHAVQYSGYGGGVEALKSNKVKKIKTHGLSKVALDAKFFVGSLVLFDNKFLPERETLPKKRKQNSVKQLLYYDQIKLPLFPNLTCLDVSCPLSSLDTLLLLCENASNLVLLKYGCKRGMTRRTDEPFKLSNMIPKCLTSTLKVIDVYNIQGDDNAVTEYFLNMWPDSNTLWQRAIRRSPILLVNGSGLRKYFFVADGEGLPRPTIQ